MHEEELWSIIDGFSRYEVSNLGRVRRSDTKKLRKLSLRKDGYYQLHLISDCGKTKTFSAHRLVAIAFIPNPQKKETVNHINEVKTDNRAKNLEWMSLYDNLMYGTGQERSKKKIREKYSKSVFQFDLDLNFIKKWDSTQDIERAGFSRSSVYEVCRGKHFQHRGYIWRLVSDVLNIGDYNG